LLQVAHELLALQLITLLLENPTDDSVEIAVDFIKEAGQILTQLTPRGTHAVFERFRAILHEGVIDKRVQYIIEGLFAVRKSNFAVSEPLGFFLCLLVGLVMKQNLRTPLSPVCQLGV
jgi:pre-mRNA-splicing factor CWC22